MPTESFPSWWTIRIFIIFCHCTNATMQLFPQVNALIWSYGPKGTWILNINSKLPTKSRGPSSHMAPLTAHRRSDACSPLRPQSSAPSPSPGVERIQGEENSRVIPVFCFRILSLEDYRNNSWGASVLWNAILISLACIFISLIFQIVYFNIS